MGIMAIFWQVYFFAMVIVFVLFPFAEQNNSYGWKSLYRLTYRDILLALVFGTIPIVNVLIAVCLSCGMVLTVGAGLFFDNWFNTPIFKRKNEASK